MGWLGEPLPPDGQAAATPFAPRCTKDLVEEALFARRKDLFSSLDLVFFDTTSIYFEGGGGSTIGSGLLWLDIVDHWVAYYSIGSIIVLQCIVFGHVAPLGEIGRRIREVWPRYIIVTWRALIRYVIPIVLALIFGLKIAGEFSCRYSDYPLLALLLGGWGAFLLALICGVLLGLWHNKKSKLQASSN